MALDARLIDDVAELSPWEAQWDSLAHDVATAFGGPAWLLPWWRHASGESLLRVVVVTEADRLVAIAPFFVDKKLRAAHRYRLLGAPVFARLEPIAASTNRSEVAATIARTLAGASPAPDVIELYRIDAAPGWPEELAAAWPGRAATVITTESLPAPTVTFGHDGYDGWWSGRSRSFRKQMRWGRRQLDDKGAQFARATDAEAIARGLAAFASLHRSRWEGRGGSSVLTSEVESALAETATALSGTDHFRLWTLSVEEEIISAQLFAAVGGRVTYWLGGFDEGWSVYQPAIQTVLCALRDAAERGDRCVDLGPGAQDYKVRFANGSDPLRSVSLNLTPRGRATTSIATATAAVRHRVPQPLKKLVRSARAGRR